MTAMMTKTTAMDGKDDKKTAKTTVNDLH